MDAETIGRQLLASKELICSFLTVLLWDSLVSIPSERRRIWNQNWSMIKVSYLVNRYWTILAQTGTAIMMLSHIPANVCDRVFWIVMFNATSIILVCDFILAIRVWAVWERSRKIGAFLATALVSEAVLMIASSWQLNPVSFPLGFANAVNWHGCTAGNAPVATRHLVAMLFWTPTLLLNGASLALIFVKHVQLSRTSNKLPIMERLLRDGLLYFIVAFVTDIPNMVFCSLKNQPGLDSIFAFPSFTIKSLVCSRMVLSLLETGSQALVADSEKKRQQQMWTGTTPPGSSWWTPPHLTPSATTTNDPRGNLARRRQTLPNLDFSYRDSIRPSPPSFASGRRGSSSGIGVGGLPTVLQVPPSAVSLAPSISYSSPTSSALSGSTLLGGGGGITFVSPFATSLVPGLGRSCSSHKSDSLLEEDEEGFEEDVVVKQEV
ncbi:hypothetical protein JCM3766R1_002830 [Sporobolomyces carnicolor]